MAHMIPIYSLYNVFPYSMVTPSKKQLILEYWLLCRVAGESHMQHVAYIF